MFTEKRQILLPIYGGAVFFAFVVVLTTCDNGPFGPSFPSGTADGDDGRELLLKVDKHDCIGGGFSPDGSKMTFGMISRESWGHTMCMMDVDTGDITPFLEEAYGGGWSPDGEWIVYGVGRNLGDIWLIRPDGTDNQPLVTSAWPDNGAGWFPDSYTLYFASSLEYPDVYDTQIYTINRDRTGLKRVTPPGRDRIYSGLHRSPDGEWYAFLSGVQVGDDIEDYEDELYIVSADGKDEHLLIPYSDTNWKITGIDGWTPDGTAIILTLAELKNGVIYREELWLYYLKDEVFRQLTFSNSSDVAVVGGSPGPSGKIVLTVYEDPYYWQETHYSLWIMDSPF
jgi:Tol biopolymer transport system component